MTTNNQKSNNEHMTTLSTNNIDEIKTHPRRSLLPDIELLSVPDEEDEIHLDETTEFENPEKELEPPIITTDTSIPIIQLLSDFSIDAKSSSTKKSLSRSYKYVQLERILTLANLLNNNDDRIKFQHEYLKSIHENKFEEFLQIYYQKLQIHNEKIKREHVLKKSRIFTFVDLEKNFLALDPTKDIKVVFIDDLTQKKPGIRPVTAHRNSSLSFESDDAAIETFYEDRSHRLLRNPSRARDEITLFARRTSERLHERLPRLSNVPHRVKIIDQRETKGKLDEHTLIQKKHKHTLSLITKRRQLIMKMMIQAKKNQNKIEKLNIQTPLTMNNTSCCRELLEKLNQIEQTIKNEQLKRPQTGFISRRISSKTSDYSSSQTITASITPSFSSCSIPFQDALSIHHIEKTNNIHVILPIRPFTAPIKQMTWVNYC